MSLGITTTKKAELLSFESTWCREQLREWRVEMVDRNEAERPPQDGFKYEDKGSSSK